MLTSIRLSPAACARSETKTRSSAWSRIRGLDEDTRTPMVNGDAVNSRMLRIEDKHPGKDFVHSRPERRGKHTQSGTAAFLRCNEKQRIVRNNSMVLEDERRRLYPTPSALPGPLSVLSFPDKLPAARQSRTAPRRAVPPIPWPIAMDRQGSGEPGRVARFSCLVG